jgi:hypothetical protein
VSSVVALDVVRAMKMWLLVSPVIPLPKLCPKEMVQLKDMLRNILCALDKSRREKKVPPRLTNFRGGI